MSENGTGGDKTKKAQNKPDMNDLKPVIVQDATTREVLMLAWANQEAVEKTKQTGYAWYWSRSRNQLWKKGDTSGNTQKVLEIRDDCDGDALLYIVLQKGVACHTGKYSCFREDKAFTLEELEQVIRQRKQEKPAGSYTVKLIEDEQLAKKKIAEEAAELIISQDRQNTIEEAADLLYHLMVLLSSKDIKFSEVLEELKVRRSGK